ncbi:uncharacterized protein PGTG_11724 [Puccinia graminis f. sp. tritici CRL 75-36-700-3]|uniref:Uncharacterized protein n=1 Tax=Puccinia graminis f. sp. tritici (strain CRL 75-36-700-3 / race SCCL) TaxID=418459 RepID=E3KNU3_PUCGT|nr:uncharacterized protein PGTG_11724 [Puccinia graminis f. sp. tritici CRL 75-36-700-3]EFP85968.2 hypothetical protein PGTG_11724 [Puccinia graminis f. sp. tritici CRL 75-36-700-3]
MSATRDPALHGIKFRSRSMRITGGRRVSLRRCNSLGHLRKPFVQWKCGTRLNRNRNDRLTSPHPFLRKIFWLLVGEACAFYILLYARRRVIISGELVILDVPLVQYNFLLGKLAPVVAARRK